ncbi:MAG TPA: hypothetical protein VNI84_03585 [Pyrinomonadaceae bacterium]|nr:hypothetical protein [Pyrinomonadaceae bacterium]
MFNRILHSAASYLRRNGRRQNFNGGRGICDVRITISDAGGTVRTTVIATFGYYRFTDITVGETYIFTAKGKRYEFTQPSQILNINDENINIEFIASPK